MPVFEAIIRTDSPSGRAAFGSAPVSTSLLTIRGACVYTSSGKYNPAELPHGTYAVTYEKPGGLKMMRENILLLDGVTTTQSTSNQGAGNAPDFDSAEEAQVLATDGLAEVVTPGIALNLIMRSGGNQSRGRVDFTGETQGLLSDNLFALRTIPADANFLFRTERDPANTPPEPLT